MGGAQDGGDRGEPRESSTGRVSISDWRWELRAGFPVAGEGEVWRRPRAQSRTGKVATGLEWPRKVSSPRVLSTCSCSSLIID